ncbi:BN159_2729 family protein [Streptomyces sp. NPDC093094]|uniref:BN159_2729 family protein n=1 Tax=Streptomyces sp. NPDC093094 TaxID=3366026 RepID=UPI003827CA36
MSEDLSTADGAAPGPGASGVLLHRGADGGWSRTRPDLTDLERQALAWDVACRRARRAAETLARELDGHPAVVGVKADRDRVRVLLHVRDLAEWAQWCAYFGLTAAGERLHPRVLAGEGWRFGVRTSVLGRTARPPVSEGETGAAVPAAGRRRAATGVALGRTTAGAPGAVLGKAGREAGGVVLGKAGREAGGAVREKRLFRLDGAVYDLTLPYRDAHGDVWYFQGEQNADGMPLMSLDGRPERCSLANVAAYAGPLTPVRRTAPGGRTFR